MSGYPYGDDFGRSSRFTRRSSSSRRPSLSTMFGNMDPFGGRPSTSRSTRDDSPGFRRGESPFSGSSSRSRFRHPPVSFNNSFSNPFSSGRRSSSSSRYAPGPDYMPPTGALGDRSRRTGVDYSATAADPYDPFAGELRRPSAFNINRMSVQVDPTLPGYRSASQYARDQLPPAYNSRSTYDRMRSRSPPRHTSFDEQVRTRSPMQYPSTRRPSHYGLSESSRLDRRDSTPGHLRYPPMGGRNSSETWSRSRDLPGPGYFSRKRGRYY